MCLDTTYLVDLWRNKDKADHPAVVLLENNRAERFVVPSHAAGEFLEGGSAISKERFRACRDFLSLFEIGVIDLDTAEKYATIVADLRRRSLLEGVSKADMWIAAWALHHGGTLVTRNRKHFDSVRNLEILDY